MFALIESQISLNLGHLVSKKRLVGQMGLNLGHLGSLTRSVGYIKEIPCGHSRNHISCSIDFKIGQNVCLDEISDEFGFRSHGVINYPNNK